MAGLGILGFIIFLIYVIKDAEEPTIPAENWGDFDKIDMAGFIMVFLQRSFRRILETENIRNREGRI